MRRMRMSSKASATRAMAASRREAASRCQAFAFTGHLAPGVLVLMLVLASLAQSASAESAMAAPPASLALVSAPPPAAIDHAASRAIDSAVSSAVSRTIDSAASSSAKPPADVGFRSGIDSPVGGELDSLLIMPAPTAAEITDESIAAAIARGIDPSRAKKSGFRKRNIDILRTEREVEIGGREMLLRLRMRVKSRETMSVELHF